MLKIFAEARWNVNRLKVKYNWKLDANIEERRVLVCLKG
jgi:hypothetical protein